MIESLFNSLSDMGFIGVIFGLIIFVGIPAVIMLVFGFALNFLLGIIPNRHIQITLTVICYILFLPCMLMFYNSFTLTKSEERLGPFFSLTLRNKSRLVIIVTIAYIFLYYKIFTSIF